MSFSWSFLDLNIVPRRLGWLFRTKLSILFFPDGSQKTLEGVGPKAISRWKKHRADMAALTDTGRVLGRSRAG